MGRLIDADALIEKLTKYKFGAIQNEVERAYIKETVINFVKDAPTSYDVDAVVKELEELKEYAKADWDTFDDEDGFSAMNAYGRAIDIVRKGGAE